MLRTRRPLGLVPFSALALVAILGGDALAQNHCEGAKLKAAGKKMSCLLTLEALESAKATAKSTDKVSKCTGKFSDAFAKAESGGVEQCATFGDESAIETQIDDFVSSVDDEVTPGPNDPPPAAGKCDAGILKAAGKRAACLLALRGTRAAKGTAIDAAKVEKCESKYDVAATKAAAAQDCTVTNASVSVADAVDAFVEEVDAALRPPCPFGQQSCPSGCRTTSVDAAACSASCVACAADQVCVSGACVTDCPAPLTKCGAGDARTCTNTESDSENCGACGVMCPSGSGCSAGSCVPELALGSAPARCTGGGPPILVPVGGGETVCTGNLSATSFTFGLCSRTNIGPLSSALTTDAFDSLEGPYKASCASNTDCGATGNCVAGACVGGAVGVNGRGPGDAGSVTPVASNTAATSVGGDLWVFGTDGLSIKGNTTVRERLIVEHGLDISKTDRVYGAATVKGPWTSGGNAFLQIDGPLTTEASCPPLSPATLQLNGGCTTAPFPALPLPCGTAADLIPVKSIVEYFRDPAHNDNATIGLPYDALDNPATALHIDLPCGYYYLNQIHAGFPVTIQVHGRTALFIGGAVAVSQKFAFDLDPTASLDVFVGGVVSVANVTTLGSPAYPRLARMYVGNSGCLGTGSCDEVSDCCSGACTACPNGPFGPCSGAGTCSANGSGNLSQAVSLSKAASSTACCGRATARSRTATRSRCTARCSPTTWMRRATRSSTTTRPRSKRATNARP